MAVHGEQSTSGVEKGHVALPVYSRVKKSKDQRSWVQRQIEIEQMRLTSKVAQVENAIRKPIEQATWSVEPNGAADEIVELVSTDLRLPIKGEDGQSARMTGRVSWMEHLKDALDSIFTGVAFFEIVYKVGEDDRLHLHKLAPRPNLSIRKIHVGDDGGLEGITQPGIGEEEDVFIPVEALVAYRNGGRDSAWEGVSVFAPARDDWLEMRKMQELQSLVMQRNGLGVHVYKASDLTAPEKRAEELSIGEGLARGIAAGETSGASIPPGATLEVTGVKGQTPDVQRSIDFYANQIAIACNATHLNLTGSGGSYALANVQLGEFIQGLQSQAEYIAATASQYIVEKMVLAAFPDYEGTFPLITATRIQVQKDLAPGDISQLAAQGVLTREPNLEAWVRSTFRIPSPRPLVEALKEKVKLRAAEQQEGVTLSDESGGEQG